MTAMPTLIIVHRYFTRRRAIASALSTVGISFWAMVASPLTRYLIELLGWRGALLILGGINLQMLVPAAMFRPSTVFSPASPKPPGLDKDNHEKKASKLHNNICVRSILTVKKYYFDRQLLNRKCLMFTITQCTRLLISDLYYARQAPIGLAIGLDSISASFLPSIVSISFCLNRPLAGCLAKLLQPVVVFGIFNLLAGTVVFCVPFLPETIVAYISMAVLFGITMGMCASYIDKQS